MDEDATLVEAVRSGDRAALGVLYDRYADRLHDFCWSVLRDREEAADTVHDTFLIAAERIGQLRDPSKLRAWLFAIARHEATRRGRARARVTEREVPDMAGTDPAPDERAGHAELAELVWSAAAGLDERDRVVMELSVRQGLETNEVADAIGVSTAHAAVLVSRMRERVERALGALLVARLGRRHCDELTRMLAGWDGRLTVLVRKRIARHADSCPTCDRRRRGALSPIALLGVVPLVAAPSALRERVLGDVDLVAAHVLGAPANARRGRDGFPPPARRPGARRTPALVAGAAALLALVLGSGVVWVLPERSSLRAPATSTSADPRAQTTTTASLNAIAVTPAASLPPGTSTGTTTGAPETDPTSTPLGAAALSLPAGSVDLGSQSTGAKVELQNTGGSPLEWSAGTTLAGLTLTPNAGTIAPGESAFITLTLDRSGMPESDFADRVDIASNGGNDSVSVKGRVERAPIVAKVSTKHSGLYPKGSKCTPQSTRITATVTDESPMKSVVLLWQFDDRTIASRSMSAVASDVFAADLGPFEKPGKVGYWVEAKDARGNIGRSSVRSLAVAAC